MEAGAEKHIQSQRPPILRAARHLSCMGVEVHIGGPGRHPRAGDGCSLLSRRAENPGSEGALCPRHCP